MRHDALVSNQNIQNDSGYMTNPLIAANSGWYSRWLPNRDECFLEVASVEWTVPVEEVHGEKKRIDLFIQLDTAGDILVHQLIPVCRPVHHNEFRLLSRAGSLATNPLFLPSMLLAPSVPVPTNFLSQVGPPKYSVNRVDVAPSIPWASSLSTFYTPTKCTLIVPFWQHRMNASSASVRPLSVEPSQMIEIYFTLSSISRITHRRAWAMWWINSAHCGE